MFEQQMVSSVINRDYDLFSTDIQEQEEQLYSAIGNSRILVIGGAGSIGSSTVKQIAPYKPKALHIVDQNENCLAELVRNLRSGFLNFDCKDFRTYPLDFGSPIMERFILESDDYDYILNFAALKHVRSEKDQYSLLQLIDTNIVKMARFLQWLSRKESRPRYFCVSTDKAANPVNLMGASKRIMERLIFSNEIVKDFQITVTSARFANVAFSNGSLLDSFLKRIRNLQPIASPENTRRFFISMQESGQICLLAAFCAPDNHLLIPRMEPEKDLIQLEDVAKHVLQYHGYEPKIYRSEVEAKQNIQSDLLKKQYPLILTPLNTSGEKPYEEFCGDEERAIDIGMKSVLGIKHQPETQGSMQQFLDEIMKMIYDPKYSISKEVIIQIFSSILPQLRHIETGRNLDERM